MRHRLAEYSIMAKRQLSETRFAIREEAIQTLKKWGDEREVCRQVEALVGSLDDTLEDKFVLEEMRALKRSGIPFQQTFADLADR
jgi:hypothetical protein